ncbi:glycine-rich RNA-binding protein 4 mitochondrial isoform X2 [Prunus yedoensis var. nudiflora]|uniref:Glycine-rich RNA-binding protein 4 mitochondrial isoform X2 n=1 Tax=Prunus yedoensis var. nudiflora TaxID=2094558 RepID=A0A314UUY6_PRUYE|nr:glycine-rich RNA-binding protein 4 mitochondrial isoform X2 [Prunus yedoensis var. nudiflora]
MAVDRITQRPKGFGFVTYKSDVEAQKALKAMNGRCRARRKDTYTYMELDEVREELATHVL